jgi:outer membrane protein OmpA-like peptidoglycan-associated protein
MLLAGCTDSAQPDPGADGSAPTEPQAPSEPAATAEGFFDGVAVEVDVAPVEVDGETALLRVSYAVEDDLQLPTLALILNGSSSQSGAEGLRLFDADERTVFPVVSDDDGNPLATGLEELRDITTEAETLSVHAAPTGDTVDVLIPTFGWVRDVPVREAGDSFDADLASLGGAPEAVEAIPLRVYAEAYDDETSVKSEGETVTVTLASDVLFATGEFTLTGEAASAVDVAAAEITASADSGEVQVVGHTDDVDTTESNQMLSERRAEAVASRLTEALGGDFTVVPSGKGETQPIAEGTSSEARAANRRVEITFDGVQQLAPSEAEATIPEPTDPVVTGVGVDVTFTAGGGEYSMAVRSVERTGQSLIGTFEVGLASGSPGSVTETMGKPDVPAATRRGFPASSAYGTAMDVSLLTSDSRVFPYDYELPAGGDGVVRRTLGDESVNDGLSEPGQTMLVTVVWPDSGEDTVTIEVPGRARFADIPVAQG